MSIFSDDEKTTPLPAVEALKAPPHAPNGYQRTPEIENEIARMLTVPQSLWLAEAKRLQNETLVFLIRHIRVHDEYVCGHLLQELCHRIMRLARRNVRHLDQLEALELIRTVQMDIIQLLITEQSSNTVDFLEVAFAHVVDRRMLDTLKAHRRSPFGRRGNVPGKAAGDEGDETERPLEMLADDRTGPEEIVRDLHDGLVLNQWLTQLLDVVKDPGHRAAVYLHYLKEWPIETNDPEQTDLVHCFNEPAHVIKYWIKKALRAMRAAARRQGIGVNK